MTEAYIFDAIRTPRGRGKSNGALYEVKPIDLLTTLLQEIRNRNQLPTQEVDDVVIGCVNTIDDQGFNIAKAALIHARWPHHVSGMTLNRYCASGLEAVNMAAAKIRSGWGELCIAGGLESLSRIPLGSDGGPLIFDPEIISANDYVPQGISADLIATIENISREEVDRYALQSHQRAAAASLSENGHTHSSLIPIYDRNHMLLLDRDEHLRPDTTLEALEALPPAFAKLGETGFDEMTLHKYPMVEKINHIHTAGNSSGIVDGAALLLVGGKQKGKALGLKPRARIVAAATVSVEHTIMLTGAGPAAKKALALAKMDKKDIQLWECNEAFAAVVLQFQRQLDVADDILNVNGGAISLGHPLGASGAMQLGILLNEMERRNLSTGLVTFCVGGGMGVATIIERT
jgi:acetyl-CoA C-acetyltransferase